MPEPNEASVIGRGREEMVPERGDPFAYDELDPRDLTPEDLARLYAEEEEPVSAEGVEPGYIGPPEDHGLGAVGPPLPEDLEPEPEAEAEAARPVRFSTAMPLPSPVADLEPEPESPDLAADEALVGMLVPDARLRSLWERADVLRSRVYEEVENLQLATRLLDKIERARNMLMAGRENFEEAERILAEVEYRIHHARRVREWSRTLGVRLLLYEVAWALLIVAGMVFLPVLVPRVFPAASADSLQDIHVALITMLWGGLGGVVGALVALRTHVARDQDFDRQWSIWYLTNPLMGIVLGAFIFLIVRAGLFALLPSSGGEIQSTWLVYALGWLAGFQQNVAYDLVERVVRIFEVEDREEPEEA